MKQLVVLLKGFKVPKIENAIVTTFNEEFEKYKVKCKKKQWRTVEGFSLDFNTCLSDLKNCVFVYPGNEDVEKWVKKFYKVLEENEIDN